MLTKTKTFLGFYKIPQKFGSDRFSRFDVNWTQTDRQTDKLNSYIDSHNAWNPIACRNSRALTYSYQSKNICAYTNPYCPVLIGQFYLPITEFSPWPFDRQYLTYVYTSKELYYTGCPNKPGNSVTDSISSF